MNSNDDLLLQVTPRIAPDHMIEVCRSFSYKLNLENHGGPRYESEDFFASRKMMVPYASAAAISELLYQECVAEVVEAVKRVKAKVRQQQEQRAAARPPAAANARNYEAWIKKNQAPDDEKIA